MTDSDKIIDRIAKLLKLAQSDNANEAASAAARATELMTQHQIAEAAVRLKMEGADTSPVEQLSQSDGFGSYRVVDKWRAVLLSGITEAMGIRYYWSSLKTEGMAKSVYTIIFVGRESVSQTARYMYLYLQSEIERLCKLEYSRLAARPLAAAATAWYNAFKIGAAVAIEKRLDAQRKEMLRETSDKTKNQALVLVKQDTKAVDAYYEHVSKLMGLRSINHSAGVKDGDALARGKAAGDAMNLNGGGKALGKGTNLLGGSK